MSTGRGTYVHRAAPRALLAGRPRHRGAVQHEERRRQHLQALREALEELGPQAAAMGSSAALVRGMRVIEVPPAPLVVVPRNSSHLRTATVVPRRADLPHEPMVVDGVALPCTRAQQTALDCARLLPLQEAVAILDGHVHRDARRLRALRRTACSLCGRGSPAARLACGWPARCPTAPPSR